MKKKRIFAFLFLICLLCNLTSYASETDKKNPKLSSKEICSLRNMTTIRVSVIPQWRPFCYKDETGDCSGLPILILEKLSQSCGIPLEMVEAKNYEDALRQLRDGEADIMSMHMTYPYEKKYEGQKNEFLTTKPYLKAQTLLFYDKNANLNNSKGYVLADVKGRVGYTHNADIPSIFYDTQIDCLNAVRSGQADIALCDVFTGAFLSQRYSSRDLLAIPTTENIEFSFALSEKMGDEVVLALEKTIDSFSHSEINQSISFGSMDDSFQLLEFVFKYPFEIICFCFSMFFVIILVIFTYFRIRLNHQRELRGYEESYRLLSDVFGEAGIEYDCLNDKMTIFGRHSKLDINERVDDFKEQLKNNSLRISLTPQEFENIIRDGMENKAYTAEFQCGVIDGGWVWYRLIYTVLCTNESHRRPIRLVGCLANIDIEHAEKEKLKELSTTDQLTKIQNHAAGEKAIRQAIELRTVPKGVMIIADIDYFKNFNDKTGHLCGDDVLRTLGAYLIEEFSAIGIVCRWGGDEFLIFADAGENKRADLLQGFARLREKMQHYNYKGKIYPVTLSMGAVRYFDGCTFDLLFQQADDALYTAKKEGRNRLCFYNPSKNSKRI